MNRIREGALYLFVLAAFGASELLGRALGIRFAAETLGTLYQYLDPSILQDDLLQGLYYLHAQPPLFNLFLGIVIKAFPQSYPAVFSFLFGAMALAILLGTAWLMRRLGIADAIAGAVCLAFALAPNFPVYRNWLFYTLPIAFLLLASAIALTFFLERQSRAMLALFLSLVTLVMLTRSAFHPLWLVAIALALTPFVEGRRRFLLAATIPLVIVSLWSLKNYAVVGSNASSSWLGLSLTKRWPLSQNEVAELKERRVIPAYWQRRPFQEPDYYEAFGFFQEPQHVHPALDALYKSNGEPNFNHRDYVTISDALFQADIDILLNHPERYFRRVTTALLLYLQPGPNSVHFLVEYDFERVHRYRAAWTRYLFWGGPIERPIRMFAPPVNLWLVLFPLVLGLGVLGATREGPGGVFAYLVLTILWVTAITNLIEIGENDRMRWEIEPFLAILFGYALNHVLLFLQCIPLDKRHENMVDGTYSCKRRSTRGSGVCPGLDGAGGP